MIEIKNLTKIYPRGKKKALDNVNVKIPNGIFGLIDAIDKFDSMKEVKKMSSETAELIAQIATASAEQNASRQFYQMMRSMGFEHVKVRFAQTPQERKKQ